MGGEALFLVETGNREAAVLLIRDFRATQKGRRNGREFGLRPFRNDKQLPGKLEFLLRRENE